MRVFVAKRLLNLITKYGMKYVLQGLIEICEQQRESYMQQLAQDLQVALDNYENRYKRGE